MKKEIISSVLGWIGIGLILFAYILVSFEIVLGDSLTYQVMNFFGCIGAFYNSYYNKSKPLMTLQIIWGIVALISIVKIYI